VLACTVDDSSSSGQLQGLDALSNVQPLHPIRVLLSGREARYLRAMAFLLARRGYETHLSLRPASLFDDVDAFGPEVVVLVEADSFGHAIGQAMSLLARGERLGVVLATSRPDAPETDQLRFVAKWGSFAVLAAAIERAWLDLPAG
jgi:hypothetical protein